MDIKKLELIPRVIEAVQFTGDNREELQTWVQDALAFQQVTATPERLYLPTVAGMEVLEVGDLAADELHLAKAEADSVEGLELEAMVGEELEGDDGLG